MYVLYLCICFLIFDKKKLNAYLSDHTKGVLPRNSVGTLLEARSYNYFPNGNLLTNLKKSIWCY